MITTLTTSTASVMAETITLYGKLVVTIQSVARRWTAKDDKR